MRRSPKSLLVSLVVLTAALVAGPAIAYVVILKDGQQITTDGKYERQGDNVILTLPNGTQASYPASDIDFAKTDEVNAGQNLSNARLIEGRKVKQLAEETVFERSRTHGFSRSFIELSFHLFSK